MAHNTFDYEIITKPLIKTRRLKTWTQDEDDLLLQLHLLFHNDWTAISNRIPNRNQNQCLHRHRRLQNKGATHKKIWSKEEDEMVVSYSKIVGRNWKMIAEAVGTKTGKQIRERFINKLDPSINKEPWSFEEDLQLIRAYKSIGPKWSEIGKELTGRPQNMIKNRFYSFITKNYEIKEKTSSGCLLEFPSLRDSTNVPEDVTDPHALEVSFEEDFSEVQIPLFKDFLQQDFFELEAVSGQQS